MEIQILKGREVAKYIDDLAALRISYFIEYPYFYEVNPEVERKYLTTFSNSPNTIFVVTREKAAGENIVGMLTGCPLVESFESYQEPFVNKEMAFDKFFCLGEFVFESGYENEALQSKMYTQLEDLIRKEQKYNQLVVYELVHQENDFEPPGYISTEEFWEKMGYAKHEDFTYTIPWVDSRTNQEVDHTLVAWIKNI